MQNLAKHFAKINLATFLAKFDKQLNCRAVQRSALCRSRRELSNADLLAKFGFDSAENEPSKVWPNESSKNEPSKQALLDRIVTAASGACVANFDDLALKLCGDAMASNLILVNSQFIARNDELMN